MTTLTEREVRAATAADPTLRALMAGLYQRGMIDGARALETYDTATPQDAPPAPDEIALDPVAVTAHPYGSLTCLDDYASAAHTVAERIPCPQVGGHIDAYRCTRCRQLFHQDDGYPPVHRCFEYVTPERTP